MADGDPRRVTRAATSRLEGADKVSGRARYTSDIDLPGQLYGGILRSRLPHARIVGADAAAAWRVPGVRDILTASDTSGISWYEEDAPLFADVARFVGDELAAVAADTEEAVGDAIAAFDVVYEPLACAADIDTARRSGAIRIHADARGNLAGSPDIYERGDVDAGFAAAEVVIEASYTTQAALHHALEPHGCNAAWHDGTLNLWVSTQGISAVRDGIAEQLGLHVDRVRVRAEHIGGGFGAKQVAWKETLIAALLARRTGKPVRIMLDREAEALAVGNRNPTRQRVRIGASRDGRLSAIAAVIDIGIGAYSVGGEESLVAGCYQSLYACANVRTEQRRIYTNMGPSVAFRAPGYVEGLFALEQAMDTLARELGIDPLVLRERNYAELDQRKKLPYSSPEALRRCYAALRQRVRERPRTASCGPSRRRGHGFAAGVWLGGGGNPPARATVTIDGNGGASVGTGTQDIGTGTRTALAQIAAETLGLPIERVGMMLGDTAAGLESPTSSGSATLATVGPAVHEAAADAKRRLTRLAGEHLGVPIETLEIAGGVIRSRNDDAIAVTFAELAELHAPEPICGVGACDTTPPDVAVRTFATHYAEVEIDVATAELMVLDVCCASDCGRIVNRKLAESQVLGGVTQGLGYALTERRIVDGGRGLVLNANLEDYLIPTALDVPPIDHAAVDLPDETANALGVKGLGEPPILGVAPAIANAIFDAVGVRIRELPISRKRLLEALVADGAR